MAIDGVLRAELEPGTGLTARYKGKEHRAEVVAGEDGKLRFRLADGREFKSPSAAGSAVMGGIACNGWRFWSIADEEAAETAETAAETAAEAAKPASREARRTKPEAAAAKQ